MTPPDRIWLVVPPRDVSVHSLTEEPSPADVAYYARGGHTVVEYAPVRRCDGCKSWRRDRNHGSPCGPHRCTEHDAYMDPGDYCSRWEAKL